MHARALTREYRYLLGLPARVGERVRQFGDTSLEPVEPIVDGRAVGLDAAQLLQRKHLREDSWVKAQGRALQSRVA